MESRKRARRGIAPSRVTASAKTSAPAFLPSIAALLDDGGQISIGAVPPIPCAAVANTDYNCLAMLQRRPGETLQQLLERLNADITAVIRSADMQRRLHELGADPEEAGIDAYADFGRREAARWAEVVTVKMRSGVCGQGTPCRR